MPDPGYWNWDRRQFEAAGPIYLNGVALSASTIWPTTVNRPTGTHRIRMADRSTVVQLVLTNPQRPSSILPMTMELSVSNLRDEGPRQAFLGVQADGLPVRLFFGLWATDRWYVPAKTAGQTIWRTSRRTAWGLPGISRGLAFPDYDPLADIDGTPLTVITSSPPSAGEITVPAANTSANYTEVETHSALAGTILSLYYPCEPVVVITEVGETVRQGNQLSFSVRAEEAIGA